MKWRRRKYVVDSRFQLKFVIAYLLASLFGSIAVLTLFNILANQALTEMIFRVHGAPQSPGEILMPLFLRAAGIAFLLFLLTLILVSGLMVRKTRGPLFRIMKSLALMNQGDFSASIRLRDADDFQDVAQALDQMRQAIRARFLSFDQDYQNFSKALSAIQTVEFGELPAEAQKALLFLIQDLQQRL